MTTTNAYTVTSIEVQGESQDVFEVYADAERSQTLAFVFDEPLARSLPNLATALAESDRKRAALADALGGCLPFLVRLGDFIGNGENASNGRMERCDAILAARAALAANAGGTK